MEKEESDGKGSEDKGREERTVKRSRRGMEGEKQRTKEGKGVERKRGWASFSP